MIIVANLGICANSSAQEQEFRVSPKAPWNDISEMDQGPEEGSILGILTDIVLYIPNRFLDLVDIFKLDLGVGPSAGVIVRATEHVQVGARFMLPASFRVGLMGRRLPAKLETNGEIAFGSSDTDRIVCSAELGAGADLFLSAYIGLCPDEFIDFLGGFILYDFKHDDLK